MNKLEGNVVAKEIKVGIVAARFNEFIVSKLIGGACDALVRHGVKDEDIDLAWVPGAFEIPIIAKKMAESGKYDAVICLGAVIKGSTSHYDLVCAETSKGIAGRACYRRADTLWDRDDRYHRAGDRARRDKGRKQRL